MNEPDCLADFAAWIGFTLPSALILILVALGIGDLSGDQAQGALREASNW